MNIWYEKVTGSDRNIPFRLVGANGKAREDAYDFLNEIGAKELNMFAYHWDDEPDELLNARMDGILGGVKKGDMVIQVYTNGSNSPRYNQFFCRKVHQFGGKIVGYIHDIELYRGNIDDWKNGRYNIPFQYKFTYDEFQNYDALLVPTENMAVRIRRDLEFTKPIVVTGPHGYKTPMIPGERKQSNTIIYAGNLEKNRSLNGLITEATELQFNIYGGVVGNYNISDFLKEHPNANLNGSFDPDAILMILEGSYGLVWDSLEYPNVSGGMGFYEILNTPHKLSMYLAAEIPVIVWSRMGLANYVIENNLGWVIDDLSQLQELITNIDEQDYRRKIQNLKKIGSLIRSGIQFKKSVLKMASTLQEKATYKVSSEEVPAPELGLDQWIIDMYQEDLNKLTEINFPMEILNYYISNNRITKQYIKAQRILKELAIID